MDVREYIKNNILIFDGAMGTMLQQKGLQIGENPEVFGLKNPDKLIEIHKLYLEAGSNVITTNTFGANELKLDKLGYTVEEVVDNAINMAKKAIEESDKSKPRFVALDLGPIGEMLEPIGTLSFDRAYEIFKRQAIQGEKSGANLIIIETMMDLYEAKAAVLAAKENTNLPVFCTMTFDENGRSFTGCMPESMVATIEGLGVDAIGVNCSLGPKQLIPIVEKISKMATVPVIVQANAGLPDIVNGQAIYNVDSEEFFIGVEKFVQLGASIIGGCCGTNPEFIKKISDNISTLKKVEIEKNNSANERTIITTLTIRMAEELTNYLKSLDIKVAYLHNEVKSLERLKIIRDLRLGKYDVLVGINLLREGLDIPEVSLIAIMDADKQGFLRSTRSLIQTIGRAARNAKGRVIMYADTISDSMNEAITETERRRTIQEEYNKVHNIVPKTIIKEIPEVVSNEIEVKPKKEKKLTKEEKLSMIEDLTKEMKEAAGNLDFERAMQLRDIIFELESE